MTTENSTTNTPGQANGQSAWTEQKSKLKQRFSDLTDEDLNFEEGQKETMYANLQTKLGKTREELDNILQSL